MQYCHLFVEYSVEIHCVVSRIDKVIHFEHGCKVHKATGVNSHISPIISVNARIAMALFTTILDVIDHLNTVLHDFSQPIDEIDVFVLLKVNKIVSSKAPGHDQSKNWLPSLSLTVKHFVRRQMNPSMYGINIEACLFIWAII